MTRRLAPIVAASLALIVAAACAATPSPATTPPAIVAGPVPTAAAPTPVPTPATPSPTLQPTAAPTTPPDEGNVDGDVYPQLTIEEPDASTLRVTLQDPEAKAWRLVVKGTGDLTFDRLEIEVETGDVAPVVTAREIHDSELVGTIDLSAFANGMGAAGGCHATLHVCIDSDGFRLPKNGNGRFRIRLSVAHAVGPLSITGSTAGWPSEPFVLGPWTGTAPFTWSRS